MAAFFYGISPPHSNNEELSFPKPESKKTVFLVTNVIFLLKKMLQPIAYINNYCILYAVKRELI